MLPGKRDLYRCCKARRSASHVNKEFWQQFQRVIRTKVESSIIGERAKRARNSQVCSIENRGYILLLASERSERDTLRSVQSRIAYILLASERSERDTPRSVQSRIVYIYTCIYALRKGACSKNYTSEKIVVIVR